jgi:beta-lactamase regulating signal transducer with metallopeptidase domain
VLFALRIVPFILAATYCLAFVLPAFLLFEPHIPNETVGYKLGIVTVVCAVGLVAALVRMFGMWWQTRRLVTTWIRRSSPIKIDGLEISSYRIKHDFPVLAVVGVIRPRIFIAEQVLASLSPFELQASVAHEIGHIEARDNLKRIAMRICSDLAVFPFAARLDRAWTEASETAADESASGGCAPHLASALVKIARLIPEGTTYKLPAGAYLLEPEGGSLAERVEALVEMAGRPVSSASNKPTFIYFAIAAFAIAVAESSLNTEFLALVHDTSENILARLQ